jgi:ABC-type dipeptide/oligopeptide/nickel transport system permease subunit
MSDIAPDMWEKLPSGETAAVASAPSLTYWQDARRRLWANKPAVISIGFIVLLILGAIFGPLFSPFTYYQQDLKLGQYSARLRNLFGHRWGRGHHALLPQRLQLQPLRGRCRGSRAWPPAR